MTKGATVACQMVHSRFIIDNGGIATEDAYPYTGSQGWCNSESAQPAPLSVDIKTYRLMRDPCNKQQLINLPCGTDLDHAVTVVGYGTSDDGTDYWLVKNSWGTSWGENGYIRMQRGLGDGGICGIAMSASYPTI
ncbi:hypothetical protein Droror1_Dr00011566 [Drosera rotundifolia]